ncbi:MAG TPA: alpha-L-fucosidase [Pyrinomonadaceae bacterium]|nr:alpha-L-fucosidase [Pyrinomonadaceae bacterium]
MTKVKIFKALVLAVLLAANCFGQTSPPKPVSPVPSKSQLAWQKLEYYAFIHFGMNTFTDHEWGEGRVPATEFFPTEFDAEQWAKVVKNSGMKGIIITAKHHDGFCLWNSKTTEYSVKNSKWRDGKGDVLKDLSEACKKYGLKFGVYISPWDRNHPLYGTPKYNAIYKEQWRELLTNYGEVFEAWLDGANDGKKRMVYDFNGFWNTIRTVQPNAVIFSDAGLDARWVGNEKGFAGEMNWSNRDNDGTFPGFADEAALNVGDENGTSWIPAECDVSIRPGWFYHKEEDAKLKSVQQLMEIYYGSVGRNCNLLLNIGVDRRGLVNENDIARLSEFKTARENAFKTNLAKGKIIASNIRGKDKTFSAEKLLDNDFETFWATDDNVRNAEFTLDFGKVTEINTVVLQENIVLGQRVKRFSIQIWNGREFETISKNTTIGYKRIIRFPKAKTNKIKILIEDSKACPVISTLEIYNTEN